MTITNLKNYAEKMNRDYSPTDRFYVTLTRKSLAYIEAYLRDRKASLEKALADPKIKPRKASNRGLEYGMVTEALQTIEKAKEL